MKPHLQQHTLIALGTLLLLLMLSSRVPAHSAVVDGLTLPINWGTIGHALVVAGVIDEQAFRSLYLSRGGLSEQGSLMLTSDYSHTVVMNQDNADELLALLWGFGLANTNPILESSEEMRNPAYGGVERFASTGGWTLARGQVTDHYGAHAFVVLSPEEQERVDRVSRTIYRPCCSNSTHFPDCNHGMAMLGLLELLAANDVSDEEMYTIAQQVNTYWFPQAASSACTT